MPKYLTVASYTPEGAKGLLKEGGTARRAVVEKLMKSLGGHLEAFYFAFGENDAYLITEVPDNVTSAALSLTVSASGSIRSRTCAASCARTAAARASPKDSAGQITGT